MLNRLHQHLAYKQRLGALFTLPILLLVIALWVTSVGAATLGPIQNASNDSAQSINPHVAQDPSGNIHVVWDSTAGSARGVRYTKGTWNGSGYTFGTSTLLADVAGYGYSSPSVAVAANGTIIVGWSQVDGLRVQSWNASQSQPSGTPTFLGSGLQSAIATDSANRFHIVWNGNFAGQYCQFENGTCTLRTTFADTQINRPSVAADSLNNIHIVWDIGSGIGYRSRAVGAPFGAPQSIDTGGNFASIAADGLGNVHIVYSRDYAIQYCRRTFTSGCTDQHTSSIDQDLGPSIGVNQDGSLAIAFRDSTTQQLFYDAKENGSWSGSRLIAHDSTTPTMSPRPYTNRMSVVWSDNYQIQHVPIMVGSGQPVATPTPLPHPAPHGTLTLNSGNPYTNSSSVSARITNTGGPAVTYTLNVGGQIRNGQWSPDGAGTQTISLSLPPTSGCQVTTVTGTLTGPGGTASFSASITYDGDIKATVTAMNPNLASNNRPIGGTQPSAMTLSYGDNHFTNEPLALLYIDPLAGECSGVNGYFIGTASDNVTSPTDARWLPFQAGTAGVVNIPPAIQDGQSYPFKVFLRDAAGNVTSNGQDASITYDTTAPNVSGSSVPATGSGSGNDIAHLDLTGVQISDATYLQMTGKAYWGVSLLVTDQPTVDGADPRWAQAGVVNQGVLGGSLDWNLYFANSVQPPVPGKSYYVHLRFVDGAGNVSSSVINSSGVVPRAFSSLKSVFIPMLRR